MEMGINGLKKLPLDLDFLFFQWNVQEEYTLF